MGYDDKNQLKNELKRSITANLTPRVRGTKTHKRTGHR
jgi:hypothetical protein